MAPVILDRPTLNFKRILYATDLSISSQNAGLYAAQFAKYFSVPLLVAHAFLLSEAAANVESNPHLVSKQRRDLRSLLSKKASRLTHGEGEFHALLLEGDPKDLIPKLADEHAPSLVVLGTHRRSWAEHELLGSVAEEILRSSRWPCLTVGPGVPTASSRILPLRHILYATDFTPTAALAAPYAVSLAERFRARLDLLNVIADDAIDDHDRLSELTKQFYAALDKLAPETAKRCCDPRTFVAEGKAHEQIFAHIREHKIDLLVLGVKKTSHLGMRMKVSGAFRLIAGADCPVLTVAG